MEPGCDGSMEDGTTFHVKEDLHYNVSIKQWAIKETAKEERTTQASTNFITIMTTVCLLFLIIFGFIIAQCVRNGHDSAELKKEQVALNKKMDVLESVTSTTISRKLQLEQ